VAVFPNLDRRHFLGALAGAAGASLLRAESSPLAATKLTDSFIEITGAGSNVLAVIGTDGVLMVDGGLKERSADLLKLVAEQSGGRPVQFLFNTHWHPENTGSNEALGKAGAKIVASENTKLWLGTEIDVGWQKKTYEPSPKAALPTQTFYTSGKMTFGKEQVEYALMPQAHTDGDIYVFFPGPNILMAGDVVSVGSYPILDYTTGGWIGGLVNAQRTLLQLSNADTRIIPGNGPVQTRADLQALNEMCNTLRDRLTKLMKQGMSPSDMIAAKPTKEYDEKWGDPELFIANAYRGLWGHVRELGGIV
jgi:glyoxylase-like metal-dependent hydrolase (beta-lactamase superfamily II)